MREKKQAADIEQEILNWQEQQLYLRKKYSFTPAGFGDPDTARRAEKKLKKAQREYQTRKTYQFLTTYELKEEGFVGRQTYLEQIVAAMKRENQTIVLYGIGGIGKTSLARACIRRIQQSDKPFDTVLFLSYNTSMEALICDDHHLPISNLCYSKDKYGSKANYFQEKMKVLRNLAMRTRLLLVIDDCNVEKDRRMAEVFSLPCHILVTTRMNPELWQKELMPEKTAEEIPNGKQCLFTTINVREFDTENEWEDFIHLYQEHPFSPEELEELSRYRIRISGHTLLMMFKIRRIEISENLLFSGNEIEKFAEDLFRRFDLSKTETQVLCELCILPVQGIEETLYHQLSKVSKRAVNKLIDCLLIRRESGWLSLHPMIAAAVKQVFRPDQKTYITMIDRIQKMTFHAWNQTYPENQRLEPYVFALLETCPVPFYWQYRSYDSMITLLWIQGYFEEALHYCRYLLETVEKHYGIYHQVTGEITLRMAAIYYNAIDFEKAHGWYVKAYQRLENSAPYDDRYAYVRSSACAKLARECHYKGQLEEALSLIEKALSVIETYDDKSQDNRENKVITRCYWMLYKARILWDMECYEEAAILGNKAQKEVSVFQDTIGSYEICEFDRFLVKVMLKHGDYDEAENLATLMVKRTDIFRQQISKDWLSVSEHLADVWAIRGKSRKAEHLYANILEILKEDFPYQKNWILRIEEKMRNVKHHLIAEETPFL